MELARSLLELAGAVSGDGGDAVVRVLRPLLEEAAPFDRGEVAVAYPLGFERWTLTSDDGPVAAEDLLRHVASRGSPLRIDDVPEAHAHPRTQELMTRQGLRSLLVLALSAAGGSEGAVVLARRHGWAFVAASMHVLVPIVGMAGLALERSRALTALRRDLASAQAELARAEQQAAASRAALEQEKRVRALDADERLREIEDRAEALRVDLQRHKDDAWRLAGERDAVAGRARDLEARMAEAIAETQRLAAELEATRRDLDAARRGSSARESERRRHARRLPDAEEPKA